MLEFDDGGYGGSAHVVDRILVAQPVAAFNGIVEMPDITHTMSRKRAFVRSSFLPAPVVFCHAVVGNSVSMRFALYESSQ